VIILLKEALSGLVGAVTSIKGVQVTASGAVTVCTNMATPVYSVVFQYGTVKL
jgi:hypothetical protein